MPGKKARARKKKSKRHDANAREATFDVDESVAAAVFAHVTNTRDRLALACSSRVWREVATFDGCWGTCDLVLDGELGEKITDERLENLLRYCGDVKHLEIRDISSSFEGSCLWFKEDEREGFGKDIRLMAKKFTSLETLTIINCPGVCDLCALSFLQDIGMPDRPKDKRMQCMRLAGCGFEFAEISQLNLFRDCLSVDQNFFLSDVEKSSFDLWECDTCDIVIDTSEVTMCVECNRKYCDDCLDEDGPEGIFFCECCNAFACNACEEIVATYLCEYCHKTVCESCLGLRDLCEGCEKMIILCNQCEGDLGSFDYEDPWLCIACEQAAPSK